MGKNYEPKALKNTMKEVKEASRVVNTEKYGKVIIRFPTEEDKQKSDVVKSEKFTELLDSGLKTEAEMEQILAKRGVWTDKEEFEIEQLQKKLTKAYERVAKSKSEKMEDNAMEEVNKIRNQIRDIQKKREAYMEHTIEAKCEKVSLGYLIYSVTSYFESGEKVWDSFSDFINNNNHQDAMKIAMEFMGMLSGIPSSFLGQSPEATETQEQSGELDGE